MVASRGVARGRKNRAKLLCFIEQCPDGVAVGQLHVPHKLEPIHRFVSFFVDDAELGDEFFAGPGAARCPVVCTDRRRAVHQLVGGSPSARRQADTVGQAKDSSRKSGGA